MGKKTAKRRTAPDKEQIAATFKDVEMKEIDAAREKYFSVEFKRTQFVKMCVRHWLDQKAVMP